MVFISIDPGRSTPTTSAESYSFRHLGRAILSNARAHIAVPVRFEPLDQAMSVAHTLQQQIEAFVVRHPESNLTATHLEILNTITKAEYDELLASYGEILHFFGSQVDPTIIASKHLNPEDTQATIMDPIDGIAHRSPDFKEEINRAYFKGQSRGQLRESGLEVPHRSIPVFETQDVVDIISTRARRYFRQNHIKHKSDPECKKTMASATSKASIESLWKHVQNFDAHSLKTMNGKPLDIVYDLLMGSASHACDFRYRPLTQVRPTEKLFQEAEVEKTRFKEQVTESPYNRDTFSSTHGIDPGLHLPRLRGKRQVIMATILAGLLGTLAGSSLMGSYTSSQLRTIRAAINEVSNKQGLIVGHVNANSESIKVNRKQLNQVTEMVDGLIANAARVESIITINELTTYCRFIIAHVRSTLQLYVDTIEAASAHRLHFGLIDLQGAQFIFEQATKLAAGEGLVPVTTSLSHLHQLPTSLIFNHKGFDLIVHIPLAREGSLFNLYRYQSFPMKLSDHVHGIIKPEKNLLAVSDGNAKDQFFYELTTEELSRCTKLGPVTVCSEVSYFIRSTSPTCLYALYTASHPETLRLCQLFVHKAYDYVMNKEPGVMVSYTKTPGTYTKRCPNSTMGGFQLDDITEIPLDPHCVVELPSFVLQPPDSLEDHTQARTFSWTLSLNRTLRGMDPSYLDEVIRSASKHFIPPLPLREIANKLELASPTTFTIETPDIISYSVTITCLVVLTLILGCACYYRRRVLQSAPHHLQDGAEEMVDLANLH